MSHMHLVDTIPCGRRSKATPLICNNASRAKPMASTTPSASRLPKSPVANALFTPSVDPAIKQRFWGDLEEGTKATSMDEGKRFCNKFERACCKASSKSSAIFTCFSVMRLACAPAVVRHATQGVQIPSRDIREVVLSPVSLRKYGSSEWMSEYVCLSSIAPILCMQHVAMTAPITSTFVEELSLWHQRRNNFNAKSVPVPQRCFAITTTWLMPFCSKRGSISRLASKSPTSPVTRRTRARYSSGSRPSTCIGSGGKVWSISIAWPPKSNAASKAKLPFPAPISTTAKPFPTFGAKAQTFARIDHSCSKYFSWYLGGRSIIVDRISKPRGGAKTAGSVR